MLDHPAGYHRAAEVATCGAVPIGPATRWAALMSDGACSRSWANKLYGPVPTKKPAGTAGGMAGYDRWKRLTTAVQMSETLWRKRCVAVAALPVHHAATDHAPLILPDDDYFHGVCAAEGCRYLGPDRPNERAALGDARRHSTQRNNSPRPAA